MWRPKTIKIALKANFGILTFKPINAAIDIAIIGPSIQAKGILKYSEIIALGIEIKITRKNSLETRDFISSLLNWIARDMNQIYFMA